MPSPTNTPAAATYATLFPEQLADRCSPDALESNSGPIAYLHALYQQTLALENTSTADQRFTLAQRRPDIGELLLNKEGLEKQIPPLTLAINALTRQAQTHAGDGSDLPSLLSEAGQHAGLPFHYPLAQIKAVLANKELPLFEVLQHSEIDFPNFCSHQLRNPELRQVMRNACGLSPATQRLLLNTDISATYVSELYGLGTATEAWEQLKDVEFFRQRLGLKTEEVLDMLAVSGVAEDATEGFPTVKKSSFYKTSAKIDGHLYGAAFINNGKTPTVTIEDAKSGEGITLSLKNATPKEFARIYQMVHLQRELQLPFEDVDLLVTSTIKAEGQSQWTKNLTDQTLRGLGAFQYLRQTYGVTAEQFSALVDSVCPYSVGQRVSLLDRVLDGPGAGQIADIDERLMINGRTFDPDKTTGEGQSNPIIGHLCRALGVSEQLTRLYLAQAKSAMRLSKHTLSLSLVGSLYRQSRVAQLFGRSLIEGSSLMKLLSLQTPELMNQLAGVPALRSTDDKPDILDVLIALANLDQWLRRQDIAPSQLLLALTPLPASVGGSPVPHSAILAGLDDIQSRLRATLLTEAQLQEAANPYSLTTGTWLDTLAEYVDAQGLLKIDRLKRRNNLTSQLTSLLSGKISAPNGSSPSDEGAVRQPAPESESPSSDANTRTPGLAGQVDTRVVAAQLQSMLANALVAQEDLARHIVINLIHSDNDPALSSDHGLLLLTWAGRTRHGLLTDVLQASTTDSAALQRFYRLAVELTHHAQLPTLLRVSPAALGALLDDPQWFSFEGVAIAERSAPEADTEQVQTSAEASSSAETAEIDTSAPGLDLCYQLSRFRDWVDVCRSNGFEESDAIAYLQNLPDSDAPGAVQAATERLSELIGWQPGETLLAAPYVNMPKKKPKKRSVQTLDDFLAKLNIEEKKRFDDPRFGVIALVDDYSFQFKTSKYGYRVLGNTIEKFNAFLKDNPGPLKLSKAQYDLAHDPARLKKLKEKYKGSDIYGYRPLTLEVYPGEGQEDSDTAYSYTSVACVPNTIADIDFILRMRALCTATGLSCQSMLDLSELGETSAYQDFDKVSQVLLATCDDDTRQTIEPPLQQQWRSALVAYLMSHWVQSDEARKRLISSPGDLSSYLLTDVEVSYDAAKTTAVTQAVSSLQHYLFRLFSHLEPGYDATVLPQNAGAAWQKYLSQYGTWKQWRAQFNHPENLIYYANRPKKSAAFKELEVEVNQGKLDTDLLHTAVCNYLTKFERLSNLQVVSGYLDGRDPKNDTYYLIGKTNTSPVEYFWRSVDMGLRDDQQRLSPLAWSEWEKIGLPLSGQIAQSSYTEKAVIVTDTEGKAVKNDKGEGVKQPPEDVTHTCDAVRPVIIAGRLYVFWVERGVTGLPSADPNNQTPTKFRKISVQYAFLQSDGFWSTPNQLMCLDGTKDGVRLADTDNPYLKTDEYVPGLIAFVNVEGERAVDPWLTVILYDCSHKDANKKPTLGVLNKDHFIEMRDLLLIERKELSEKEEEDTLKTAYASYADVRNIQHTYDGAQLIPKRSEDLEEESFGYDRSTTIKINFEVRQAPNDTKKIQVIVTPTESDDHSYRNDKLSVTMLTPAHRESTAKLLNNMYRFEFAYGGPGEYIFSVKYVEYEEKNSYIYVIDEGETDEKWNISIKTNKEQAQYLDLTSVSTELPTFASNKVRLNTLFGKQLVARANQSVELALGWDTQKLQEPTIDEAYPNPPLDFHGGNGLYFRELFLHLPALIATRLTEQQQFEDAEAWYLRCLFDPYRATSQADGRPEYWNTRPLAEVGNLKSELRKSVDPTARAFILSRFYRQAVFLSLVENWQLQGDHYYRQLTLSTLNHAWLCYQQALKLIGPLPERAAVSRWSPIQLSTVADNSFRTPINLRVIKARDIIEHRLYNLRHGLTIDGKALPKLSWGDEGGDPFASAKGGLSIVASSYNSNYAAIPAYRFRQLLPAARAAAQQLLDLGRHYMKLMEDEFNTSLSVLLKSQEIKISDFTLRLRKEDLNSVTAKKRALGLSLQAAEFRKEHWARLLEVGRSPREEAATALIWTAGLLKYAAIPTEIAASGTDGIVPTILGMAVGGTKPSALIRMGAKAMSMSSTGMKFAADQLLAESSYERRATGWKFDMQQAEWDIKQIDQQIIDTDIELNAATISLEESRQERRNLEEAYVAMTTGFTIIPIYNWLVPRQQLLYGAAYDAVLSLCLSLESAWQYEIGDYSREAFIKTSAWSDSYKGMLAGESLLVDLQQMENAYLQANERRLTIKKSFSLKTLLGDDQWKTGIENLANNKALLFDFQADHFDQNYPGHYLRQLKHVSVSFVMEAGKELGEISAVLTQSGNTTLVTPDSKGVTYLYKVDSPIPASIKRNLRAQQQIALSSSVSEDGLGYSPGEWVYELMFHDGRYLPFEGTGAISQWQLEIPDVGFAKSLMDGKATHVKDIQINLVYTALGADAKFTKLVIKQRNAPKTSSES